MELAAAKEEGFVSKYYEVDNVKPKKKPLVVIGILTSFGRKNKRDAIRKAWMGTGKIESAVLLFFVSEIKAINSALETNGLFTKKDLSLASTTFLINQQTFLNSWFSHCLLLLTNR